MAESTVLSIKTHDSKLINYSIFNTSSCDSYCGNSGSSNSSLSKMNSLSSISLNRSPSSKTIFNIC